MYGGDCCAAEQLSFGTKTSQHPHEAFKNKIVMEHIDFSSGNNANQTYFGVVATRKKKYIKF